MVEFVDIVRCVVNVLFEDDRLMNYLFICFEDLRVVIDRRKFDVFIVEIFGVRIEKLIRLVYFLYGLNN